MANVGRPTKHTPALLKKAHEYVDGAWEDARKDQQHKRLSGVFEMGASDV